MRKKKTRETNGERKQREDEDQPEAENEEGRGSVSDGGREKRKSENISVVY